ncbi:MAG: STAS domain-containing protein [Bacillota bacterium]|nr:STAS domain-containing protein [Bacillota bacterium]
MNSRNIVLSENFSVDEAAEFREKIHILIKNGEKHFTVDFSKCSFIDSTGLGVLVGIYKKCVEINGHIQLTSINNPQVMKIFQLTRLDKVFNLDI